MTKINPISHPAKFSLKFEERHPTAEGHAPDIEKSDFINIIHNYYDSELDTENSIENAINANIDVQRYYSPLLKSGVPEEIKKLKKTFSTEKNKLEKQLLERGVAK